jgi:hypothetical protein
MVLARPMSGWIQQQFSKQKPWRSCSIASFLLLALGACRVYESTLLGEPARHWTTSYSVRQILVHVIVHRAGT